MKTSHFTALSRRDLLAGMLLVAAVVGGCVLFFLTWDQPIVDYHAFRQTQTALTVYWGIVEEWRLAYLTPVVGSPWSIPFEFPLFQWLVSLIWKVTGLPLDNCGRLTSFAFHLANGLLFTLVLEKFGCNRVGSWVGGALFLVAPVNLFWGRAFLIESCALFLALAYVYCAITAASLRSLGSSEFAKYFVAALIFAVLAALTKITTFVVPVGIVGLYFLGLLIARLRGGRAEGASRRQVLIDATLVAIPVAIALVATVLWVDFSDHTKSQGLIGALLQSDKLRGWNFGTLEQRFSAALWGEAVLRRSVEEAVGVMSAVAVLLLALIFVRGRALAAMLSFLVAYIASFLLFPNLHAVHNYYQYSAAIWLIGAAAVVVSAASVSSPQLAFALTAVVFASQIHAFSERYSGAMFAQIAPQSNRAMGVGNILKSSTSRDEVVVIFGNDWSSDIAYYSNRRTITVPGWGIQPKAVLDEIETLSSPYVATRAVVCNPESHRDLISLVEGRANGPGESAFGCLVYRIGLK